MDLNQLAFDGSLNLKWQNILWMCVNTHVLTLRSHCHEKNGRRRMSEMDMDQESGSPWLGITTQGPARWNDFPEECENLMKSRTAIFKERRITAKRLDGSWDIVNCQTLTNWRCASRLHSCRPVGVSNLTRLCHGLDGWKVNKAVIWKKKNVIRMSHDLAWNWHKNWLDIIGARYRWCHPNISWWKIAIFLDERSWSFLKVSLVV